MYRNECPPVSLALRSFRKTFERQPGVPCSEHCTQTISTNRPTFICSILSPLATHCPGWLLCVCDTSTALSHLPNAPKSRRGRELLIRQSPQ